MLYQPAPSQQLVAFLYLFFASILFAFQKKFDCLHTFYTKYVFSMPTFHVEGWLELIILVDGIYTIVVSKKRLCAMFGFQLGSLQISKDVAYDANNNVSNSMY
jgi:hypothetical protein